MGSESSQTPYNSDTEHNLINFSTFYKFKLTRQPYIFFDGLNNSNIILDQIPLYHIFSIWALQYSLLFAHMLPAHTHYSDGCTEKRSGKII